MVTPLNTLADAAARQAEAIARQAKAKDNRNKDPRIARSRAAVRGAVMTLLRAGRDFDTLTVSEVARTAGITRKTFYARFGSLDGVVEELISDVLDSVTDQIDDSMLVFPLQDNSLAKLVLATYQQQRHELEPLLNHCAASLFLKPASQIFANLLDRVVEVNCLPPMPTIEQEYIIAMGGSMTHALMMVWVKRGFTDPPEQLATLIYKLFGTGLQQVLSDSPG